ncbi:hypothetical protein MUK42_22027 [Musa troglodytarum]|uniref:Uncharacterized protein n=1 Tax=Musa troglodytarum TaxID=320322 RepID=A0A9E7G9U8_9LILI|nr:hypothetical protein MUK42_22027 [Musa troglodytarum]
MSFFSTGFEAEERCGFPWPKRQHHRGLGNPSVGDWRGGAPDAGFGMGAIQQSKQAAVERHGRGNGVFGGNQLASRCEPKPCLVKKPKVWSSFPVPVTTIFPDD